MIIKNDQACGQNKLLEVKNIIKCKIQWICKFNSILDTAEERMW